MNVSFYFEANPFAKWQDSPNEDRELGEAVMEKVHDKVISFPFDIKPYMIINILYLKDIYGFTEKEIEFLEVDSLYNITDFMIKPDHIEIWLNNS